MRPIGEGIRLRARRGRYWARLETREALAQEGTRVAFAVCAAATGYVERYVDAEPLPPVGVWSLRNVSGWTSLTAVVDVRPHLNRYGVVSLRRPDGGDVPSDLLPDVEILLEFCDRMTGVHRRADRAIAAVAGRAA